MTPEQNLEIVKEAYLLFDKGDIRALLDLYSEDIKWSVPPMENVPYSGERHGRSDVLKFFAELANDAFFLHFEATEFVSVGNRVVVFGNERARVRSTNHEYRTNWVHTYKLNDGKISEFCEYIDTATVVNAHMRAAVAA